MELSKSYGPSKLPGIRSEAIVIALQSGHAYQYGVRWPKRAECRFLVVKEES